VVQRLAEDPDVAEVIGIDIREPRYDLGRADYLKLDIRHSLIGKLVRAVGIDTVVHTLTRVDSFDMDPVRAHEMNVIGTLNLLAGCAGEGSPVRRFILKSSGHVYGSRFDLPTGLREDYRLDINSGHQFVRDIVEVESYVSDFAVRNPNITILALRFANSLNPDEPQPLARYLDLEVVPTVIGYDPQLHRGDGDGRQARTGRRVQHRAAGQRAAVDAARLRRQAARPTAAAIRSRRRGVRVSPGRDRLSVAAAPRPPAMGTHALDHQVSPRAGLPSQARHARGV
jgi:UDP-glucose 4-epimerase